MLGCPDEQSDCHVKAIIGSEHQACKPDQSVVASGYDSFMTGTGAGRVTLEWERLSVALPKKKSNTLVPIFEDLQGSAKPGRWVQLLSVALLRTAQLFHNTALPERCRLDHTVSMQHDRSQATRSRFVQFKFNI